MFPLLLPPPQTASDGTEISLAIQSPPIVILLQRMVKVSVAGVDPDQLNILANSPAASELAVATFAPVELSITKLSTALVSAEVIAIRSWLLPTFSTVKLTRLIDSACILR